MSHRTTPDRRRYPLAARLAPGLITLGWVLLPAVVSQVPAAVSDVAAHPPLAAAASASGRLDLVGQVGGITLDVVALGSHAYAGLGPRVAVYDVARPTAPRRLGESGILSGVVLDLDAAGKLAAAATGPGGLELLSLESPAAPRRAGHVETSGEISSVAVAGNVICAAAAEEEPALWVIDAVDPGRPRLTARIELPAEAYGLTMWQGHVFFMVEEEGLRVVDVSRPDRPREVSRLTLAASLGGSNGEISIDSGFAFVADGPNGLFVIDVIDPAAPRLVGQLEDTDNARGVFATGGYAFVADGGAGLAVVDVSTPARPRLAGRLATDGPAVRATVTGDIALVAQERELGIVDVAAPEAIRSIASIEVPAYLTGVATAGTAAFAFDSVGSRLWSIGISPPESARVLEMADAPAAGHEGLAVSVADGHAYVANGQQGLLIFDVRDPTDIDDVGVFDRVPALDVDVVSGHADVAAGVAGLQLVDVTDPSRPAVSGAYASDEAATALFAQAERAFVMTGPTLHIVDTRDPKAPRLLARYPTGDDVNDGVVAADRDHAYLATDRLHVLDLADLTHPARLGTWEPPEYGLVAPRIATDGAQVFVSDYVNSEIWTVDITQPSDPHTLAQARLPIGGLALDVAVQRAPGGGAAHVLVGAGDAGLCIFRYLPLGGGQAGTVYLPVTRNR